MAEPRDTDAFSEHRSSHFDTNKSRQSCQKKSIYKDITELQKRVFAQILHKHIMKRKPSQKYIKIQMIEHLFP